MCSSDLPVLERSDLLHHGERSNRQTLIASAYLVTSFDDDERSDSAVAHEQLGGAIAALHELAFLLLVPPEGTRKEVERWKTGFYYIALGAEVPVVMAYMDHATRLCGVNRIFRPTGDLESDMTAIRAYYAPFRGWAKRHEARV